MVDNDEEVKWKEDSIFPMNYHTWVWPVFMPESPLGGALEGMTKCEPTYISGVYLGYYPFHAIELELVLNIRTGYVNPQYHVVFDDNVSTVDQIKKGTIRGNSKNLVEEHS